jgi:hypothetical protein
MYTQSSELMRLTLSLAVPLRIGEIQQCGGPKDIDWEEARATADVLASNGDILQFGAHKPGLVANRMTCLARALAVMAFVPGGVRFAEMHFEVGKEG